MRDDQSNGDVPGEVREGETEGGDEGESGAREALRSHGDPPAHFEASAMEGGRVLETWDDLLDLAPGERVHVPLPSPVAEAVWVWHKSLTSETPPGEMARGIRDVLQGLHENQKNQILEGVVSLLTGLARMRLR